MIIECFCCGCCVVLCYVSVVIYKGKLEEKCEVKCVPGKEKEEVNLRKEIE